MDPNLPNAVDKRAHHLDAKHLGNADAQRAYQEHIQSLFAPLGLTLRFDGQNGNTLRAHRIIQRVQDDRGADAAGALVDALFRRYFTEAQHPATQDTLVGACVEAGLSEDEARALTEDDEMGDREVRQKIRTVAMDVDAVPMVTFEGRRRDITLTGAKEVSAYVKAMETIIKEST
jgi:predicted DsbA family dithiol-disulfide isomerase